MFPFRAFYFLFWAIVIATGVQGSVIGPRDQDLKSKKFIAFDTVDFDGATYIFFSTYQGQVGYWRSTNIDESPTSPNYVEHLLVIDGAPVETRVNNGVPAVSVFSSLHWLRLYYVDPSGYLREGGKDSGGKFFNNGALNKLNVQVAENSGISACAQAAQGNFKVFYYSVDSPTQISVAYAGPYADWRNKTVTPPLKP